MNCFGILSNIYKCIAKRLHISRQIPSLCSLCITEGFSPKQLKDCLVGWLVNCFGLNGSLNQYLSLYRAVCQRQGERIEK